MSKSNYRKFEPPRRLAEWFRAIRAENGFTLREVAEATGMDLAHLQKIETDQRIPTEEQTDRLADYYGVDRQTAQARRIAEKFRREFSDNPAAADAIGILAEESGSYIAKPISKK